MEVFESESTGDSSTPNSKIRYGRASGGKSTELLSALTGSVAGYLMTPCGRSGHSTRQSNIPMYVQRRSYLLTL